MLKSLEISFDFLACTTFIFSSSKYRTIIWASLYPISTPSFISFSMSVEAMILKCFSSFGIKPTLVKYKLELVLKINSFISLHYRCNVLLFINFSHESGKVRNRLNLYFVEMEKENKG